MKFTLSFSARRCIAAASILAFLPSISLAQRQVTIRNNCDYTVWPADIPAGSSPSLSAGGFELTSGSSRTLALPTAWSGRFWGRTGCTFDSNGYGLCETGDCGGYLDCPTTITGQPPASLVEFTLGASESGIDFYDVSLVDGYNLPVSFGPVNAPASGQSCGSPHCAVDLNTRCPQDVSVYDAGGQVVACKSMCLATGEPVYCCAGAYDTPQTCTINNQAELFKSLCPTVYTWAYDDPTSTFTCPAAYDFQLTFCPA